MPACDAHHSPPAAPQATKTAREKWSARPDSNRRQPRWQRGALPTELLPPPQKIMSQRDQEIMSQRGLLNIAMLNYRVKKAVGPSPGEIRRRSGTGPIIRPCTGSAPFPCSVWGAALFRPSLCCRRCSSCASVSPRDTTVDPHGRLWKKASRVSDWPFPCRGGWFPKS